MCLRIQALPSNSTSFYNNENCQCEIPGDNNVGIRLQDCGGIKEAV